MSVNTKQEVRNEAQEDEARFVQEPEAARENGNSAVKASELRPNCISQVSPDPSAYEKTVNSKPKAKIHKVCVDTIVFPWQAYPRRDADDGIKIDRDKVNTLLDLLLIGKVLKPIVLILVNSVVFLIDGFHRWEAAYRRWEMVLDGAVEGISAEDAQWIEAEFIDSIPADIHEQVFAGTYNTVHGKNLSPPDIERLVCLQYDHTPGMTAVEMANMLNISRKTAEKYMEGTAKAFGLKKFKAIEELRKADPPVPWERVAETVRKRWPRAKGLSDRQLQAFYKEHAEKVTVTKIALPPFLRTPTPPAHQKSEKRSANKKTDPKDGTGGGEHSLREGYPLTPEKEPASPPTVDVPEHFTHGTKDGTPDTADAPIAASADSGGITNPGLLAVESINSSGAKVNSSGANEEGTTSLINEIVDSHIPGAKKPSLDDVVQLDSDPTWVRVWVGDLTSPQLKEIRQRLYREIRDYYSDQGLQWP